MAKIVSIQFKNFDKFGKALNSTRFRSLLQKHVARATGRAARITQKAIRQEIKSGVPPRQAALTAALKGSSKTLVDKGDLFQSISVDQKSWDQAFVGVHRKAGIYNIAEALHEGREIPVSQKMRALFFYLWLASMSANGMRTGPPPRLTGRAAQLFQQFKDWLPLKDSTRIIRIPARPFLRRAFAQADLQKRIQEEWRSAVDQAYRESLK
jgi:phage gpG-like protein